MWYNWFSTLEERLHLAQLAISSEKVFKKCPVSGYELDDEEDGFHSGTATCMMHLDEILTIYFVIWAFYELILNF